MHCIFFYIVLGINKFSRSQDDQTSLWSVLCPTPVFTCAVTVFIVISKTKSPKPCKKKKKTTKKPKQQQRQSYFENSSNFFVYVFSSTIVVSIRPKKQLKVSPPPFFSMKLLFFYLFIGLFDVHVKQCCPTIHRNFILLSFF